MESNHANSAALRAFRILEAIAQHLDGCTVAEVAASVELPKQTVHRLVRTLEYGGLVFREPGLRQLQLGCRLERFSIAALMNGPGRAERHAILSAVVESTGETCNLTALAGTDIVYLDRVETSWPLRMMLAPGSHVPLHATSSGKLLASLLPKPQRERLLRDLTLRAFTENTIIDRDALEAELRETSRRRIGINRSEHLRGMSGVAVPVMIDRQRACAAVAIQAPEGRMSLEELLAHVPRLREAAAAIGETFGRPQESA